MRRVILTTCTCDNWYVNVMKVFLVSLKRSGCDVPVHADIINGNDETHRQLRGLYPSLEINSIEIPGEHNWEDDQELVKIFRTRPGQMTRELEAGWDQVMSIDCDTIVRRPIDKIWDGVVPGSLKIMDRGKKRKSYNRYQGGVYVWGNSPLVREFNRVMIERIGTNFEFFDGQRTKYELMAGEFKDKIQHVQLDRKYNDNHFGDDSIIWHAKHGSLKRDKFAKEFNRYLSEAK